MKDDIRYYSRRTFINHSAIFGMAIISRPFHSFLTGMPGYDHFLLGCADLENGIRFIKDRTGVEAVKGGKHPGIGTHNALISLGDSVYLEIIAPDPGATSLNPEYSFLTEMQTPHLFYWAMHTSHIEDFRAQVLKMGYSHSAIQPGSRERKDGSMLKWKSMTITTPVEEGVPFFIEWDANSKHPSIDSPKGCSLKSFIVDSPHAGTLKTIFKKLGIAVKVSKQQKAGYHLTLKTPKGTVEL